MFGFHRWFAYRREHVFGRGEFTSCDPSVHAVLEFLGDAE